ncbi:MULTISPECIES: hypothetical protein [Chryseobacterium]|uniref:hypothetical protein n=1 Tax=Chryseobacterium sp. R2A-55 TaxID=2744445 RepID=UPI001F2CBD24|nr:hypothetical protein [Chryseobacterium sp. R2A-55]
MRFKKLYLLLITALITVFVFNLPILTAFRNHVKYKVKVDLINKNFKRKTVLAFAHDQLKNAQWIDQHEFVLDDEMFDVIMKEEIDGKTIYHCYKDAKENKIRKIQKFIAEHLSFKNHQIPEIGVPKLVFHQPPNHFCEGVQTERIEFLKIIFYSTEFPSLNFSFTDSYLCKLKIPPENYC